MGLKAMSKYQPYTAEDTGRFAAIVEKILANEGAAVFENVTTGEVSKYGISLKFLQSIRPSVTKLNVVGLTREGATRLYQQFFWLGPQIWRLDDDKLAFKVADLGVNMGPVSAIKLLQQALTGEVKVDGVLGPLTADVANNADQELLLARILDFAERRYRLIAKNPAQAKFLNGWLARLEKV